MAALLGRLRREMNGAVAEAMAQGGISGLLNYGVSIPTIVAIAQQEGTDHEFARYLYRQQVRELRIASLVIADPASLTLYEAEEWLSGAQTWELRDLLACYLFSAAGERLLPAIDVWLETGDEVTCATAILTLARNGAPLEEDRMKLVTDALARFPESETLSTRVVRLLSFRYLTPPTLVLPDTPAGRYVREELVALYGE